VEIFYKEACMSHVAGCTVMPHAMRRHENLKEFKGITLLADIGNGTMNMMYLNNADRWKVKHGQKTGLFHVTSDYQYGRMHGR
jgi:plasmid segregation protein ParM